MFWYFFTNMTIVIHIYLYITYHNYSKIGCMKSKSQFYGLKNARNNGFIFNEVVIITIKIDSSLSKLNTV